MFYPELFGCSLNQNDTLETVLISEGPGRLRDWNLVFGRGFDDWLLDQVMSFFSLLHSHTPWREDTDKLRWKLNHFFITHCEPLWRCISIGRVLGGEGP